MKHADRTALITGAASGIGRVTASRLAQEGARVALVDRHPAVHEFADYLAREGARALAWTVDVADARAVEVAVEEACSELGPIDLLINAAGIVSHIAPIASMTPDGWTREIAVNLGGPFNFIRVVAPQMKKQGFGRIVNISSLAARGGLNMQAGYAASKSGLLGLTRNVTLEFARHGVTCNAILPGLIATENVLAMPRAISAAGLEATPARRLGRPDEVAALVSFLCLEEAGFINGAEIDISGGAHLNQLSLVHPK